MELFQIGDIVRWSSHGVIKEGMVAGEIASGHKAGDLPEEWLGRYILQFPKTSPRRDNDSYLVRVDNKKNKPKLFWPKAELLVLVCRPEMSNADVG